jgi:hypothetical protein
VPNSAGDDRQRSAPAAIKGYNFDIAPYRLPDGTASPSALAIEKSHQTTRRTDKTGIAEQQTVYHHAPRGMRLNNAPVNTTAVMYILLYIRLDYAGKTRNTRPGGKYGCSGIRAVLYDTLQSK